MIYIIKKFKDHGWFSEVWFRGGFFELGLRSDLGKFGNVENLLKTGKSAKYRLLCQNMDFYCKILKNWGKVGKIDMGGVGDKNVEHKEFKVS